MVFFDIDGILIDHSHAQERAALALYDEFGDRIRSTKEDFPAVWRHASATHFSRSEQDDCVLHEQQRRLIREVFRARRMTDAQADELFRLYLRYYESNWTLFPDVLPALDTLGQQDVRLGVLSVGDPRQQHAKLARFGLTQRFAPALVIQPGMGFKSSKDVFDFAAQQAGIPAGDCLYVGDDLKNDALAAVAAGWRGAWLDRTGIMKAAGTVEVINSLREVSLMLQLPRLKDWPGQ